jgi:thiamine biosynthesis lipoprotein
LTGEPIREALERSAEDEPAGSYLPVATDTIRLGKVAMAGNFEVILPPDQGNLLSAASDALDVIDRLEDQMSIYRPGSELSRLNQRAADESVVVERRLYELLKETVRYAHEFEGAFDPTAGPLVALWRQCRREHRVPADAEVSAARRHLGYYDVEFDDTNCSIRYRRPGIELNLNAIGKGYALDRAGEGISDFGFRISEVVVPKSEIRNPKSSPWLMHGGYSSILACGSLPGAAGWPIGIRHPLVPHRRLATIVLRDRGMSTSGSAVQFFRVGEKRYGHILDPRTGWPAEGMLSVTVLAPTAARAEALSTAFFVLGVEKAQACCHNQSDVSAVLIPEPRQGQRLEPVICGLSETDLIWESDG